MGAWKKIMKGDLLCKKIETALVVERRGTEGVQFSFKN